MDISLFVFALQQGDAINWQTLGIFLLGSLTGWLTRAMRDH
jgi:hypothetical protein